MGFAVCWLGRARIVTTNFSKEAPNVVTETQFKLLLRQGYKAEVVCRSAAFRKAAVWYGEWFIRVVSSDGSVEKLLVPFPRGGPQNEEIPLRMFKTANGLISFLDGMGFDQARLPLREGGREVLILPQVPEVSQP